jgi:HPt (histidine-containing phosphotransfer) domain-containing protein
VDGDEQLLGELTMLFLKDAPQQLNMMQQCLKKQDVLQLRLHAHALRGSAANFGATAVREVSRELEKASLDHDLEGATVLVSQLAQHLEVLKLVLVGEMV